MKTDEFNIPFARWINVRFLLLSCLHMCNRSSCSQRIISYSSHKTRPYIQWYMYIYIWIVWARIFFCCSWRISNHAALSVAFNTLLRRFLSSFYILKVKRVHPMHNRKIIAKTVEKRTFKFKKNDCWTIFLVWYFLASNLHTWWQNEKSML